MTNLTKTKLSLDRTIFSTNSIKTINSTAGFKNLIII